MSGRIEKANEAVRNTDPRSHPSFIVKRVLKSVAEGGPVAVLPGGRVVGMEPHRMRCDEGCTADVYVLESHPDLTLDHCEEHGLPWHPTLYRPMADEEDGDEH